MSYKLHHKPLAGESYVRCHQIVIDNRLDRVPVIQYHQERVIADNAGTISKLPMGPTPQEFDPSAEVPIIDPETGEPTGEVLTQGQLMAYVYSAYIAAVTPKPTEEELEEPLA